MTTALATIFVFGLIVFIHELGHFILNLHGRNLLLFLQGLYLIFYWPLFYSLASMQQ